MTGFKGWVLGLSLILIIGLAGVLGYLFGPDGTSVSSTSNSDAVQLDVRRAANPEADDSGSEIGSVFTDNSTENLSYLGLTTTVDADTAKACLRFSSPLNPDRVIDDKAFVRVNPDVPFSLQVEGSSLCVLGLGEVDGQTITVLPGFTALNGAELRFEQTETASFEAKPAMVGFVGDGIILPRLDNATLGIKAMNADAVELTLYRVNHRALFEQTPDVGESALEGEWSWNSAAWSTRAEIHSDRIETAGPVNEVVEVGYALGDIVSEHGAGAYIVQIQREAPDNSRAIATAWRWLYVTDLALASYRTPDALNVTVRSIETADTVGAVNLTLIARNNDILAQVQSDANGRAKIPGAALRGTGNMAPKMLLAYAGEDDFAALDLARSPLDLTAYDVTGRDVPGLVDAYLYTERGVYRPGERVNLTALIRDREGHAAFDRNGTLIIRQPDGTEFSSARISPQNLAGAMLRQIRLPRNAPRGRWSAALELDGLDEVGAVRFAVEDFIPEQLRLDVRADEAPIRLGENRSLTVAADFLYGAAGRDLDAEAEARIAVDPAPFPQWADYQFGDAIETYREQFVVIGQGRTNENGLFQTNIDLAGEAYQSRSPLRLFVTAGVAEPSGRYVRDSLFLPLRSENAYVGFDPIFEGGYAKRNRPADIDLIAVDADGERIAASGRIALIREDYDYHWYRENGRWRYRRDRRDILIDEAAISLEADSPYRFSQALPYGQYRLQFTTDAGANFSYQFGSGWSRAGSGTDAPDRIEIGLSQTDVSPGDQVVLSVSSPFSGTGELVIADQGVRTVQTVRINEGESEIRLPIARDWTTDLYALLTVYTPAAEGQPRRAVGLVHIPVDRSEQRLEVTLDLPEKMTPRQSQDVSIKVAGLDGEQAFLTLAAVDSGILQITDFAPPDPEQYLFGKRAFPIDIFDDYARMLAPFSSVDRVGGDTLGGAGLSVVPTTIVSLFDGPVEIRNGEAIVTLDVPDFQGEVTVMAVAWSETKIGSASETMIVRDPVTMQLALPRFLAPGDNAITTVAMDNIEGQDGQYVARITRDGDDVGVIERELTQGARSEDTVSVTADILGVSTYRLEGEGPQFSVARDYQIETRPAVMPITRSRFLRVEPGEAMTLNIADDMSGLIADSADVLVTASFSPGVDARPLLASLRRYPYGCTEQTVSVAQPLLMSEQIGSLPDMSDTQRRASIQSAVDTLLSRQSADGSFGLWRRGDGYASPYLQLYASDFILQAEAAGFDVARSAKDRTLNSVRTLASLEGNGSLSLDYNFGLQDDAPDYELRAAERAAQALALLARHDRVRKTDLLYVDRRFGERLRSSLSQSKLGYALAAMGEETRAAAAFSRAADRIGGSGVTYYDSPIRNAAALVSLSDMLPEDSLTDAMLTLQVDNPQYLNTHEKAWLLRALAGRRVDGVPFGAVDGWTRSGSAASQSVAASRSEVVIENVENAPVWLQVTATGLPQGPMQAQASNASLRKSLFTMDGGRANVNAVVRGDRLVVLLEAEASSANSAMWVMADLLPAGFEIETVLTPDDAGETGAFSWLGDLSATDIAEARDDRFVTSWRTQSRYDGGPRRVAYILRATTEGDFALPGAHLEDMYRPSRMATTAGSRISVTPPPTL